MPRGRRGGGRFAAKNATRGRGEDAARGERARLYETAAWAIANGSDEGLSALERAATGVLGEDDMELLVATRAVVGEIRRLPPPSAPPTETQLTEMAGSMKAVGSARRTIDRVDRLLSEARK